LWGFCGVVVVGGGCDRGKELMMKGLRGELKAHGRSLSVVKRVLLKTAPPKQSGKKKRNIRDLFGEEGKIFWQLKKK